MNARARRILAVVGAPEGIRRGRGRLGLCFFACLENRDTRAQAWRLPAPRLAVACSARCPANPWLLLPSQQFPARMRAPGVSSQARRAVQRHFSPEAASGRQAANHNDLAGVR